MGLFDLFRPKWKHSDAEVRARAVRQLTDEILLAQVARTDPEPRIRRIAIKRIFDTALLGELAANDPDQEVREAAQDKLAEISLEVALAGGDEANALAALDRITAQRTLADVALRATIAGVRIEAVRRLTDQRALADVVRSTTDDEVRALVWERLREPAVLRDLASGDVSKWVALKAIDVLDDVEALEVVARKAQTKAVRQAARRKADTLSGKKVAPQVQISVGETPEERRAREAALEIQRRAEEERRRQIERLRAAEEAQRKAQATRAQAPSKKAEAAPASADEVEKQRLAAEKERIRKEREAEKERLAAEKERLRKEREAEKERLAAEKERIRKEREAEKERIRKEREAEKEPIRKEREAEAQRNLQTVEEILTHLESLADSADAKVVSEALASAQMAFRNVKRLPKGTAAAIRERYEKIRSTLRIRLSELREAEEWKRWANVPQFEALCGKAEELLKAVETPGADLKKCASDLAALKAEWKGLGGAPRERSEELWNRFHGTCTLIHAALRRVAKEREQERLENLKRKEELCARVEALKDAEDVEETALLIKNIQEEWKAIGPVPKNASEAIWKRFRAACDYFFARRDAALLENDPEVQEALAKRRAIAEEAEALKDSTDWNAVAARLKALQTEWKSLPPAPKAASDEIWKRFRSACNHFFARRKARFAQLEEEREQNLADKVALCERAEKAAEQGPNPEEARRLMVEWKKIGPVPKAEADKVWHRFRAALSALRGNASPEEAAEASQPSEQQEQGAPQAHTSVPADESAPK